MNNKWIGDIISQRKLHKPLLQILAVVCFCVLMGMGSILGNVAAYAEETPKTPLYDGQRQVVRVGYCEVDNFMEGASDDEKKSGYAYEYMQKIAYSAGWEYEYVYAESTEELVKLMKKGKIDILAGMYKDDDNKKFAAFPYSSMGREYYYIYTTEDKVAYIQQEERIKGASIGVTANTPMEVQLKKWNKQNNQGATIVAYDTDEERLDALKNGKTTFTADVDKEVIKTNKLVSVARFGYSDFYLGVNKDREDLLNQLNVAQVDVESSEPYLTAELSEKYFGDSGVKTTLSANELNWMNQHETVEIGYLNKYPPFSNEKDGEAVGTFIDVVEAAFAEKDIESKAEYIAYDNYDDLMDDLKNGDLDLVGPMADDLAATEANGLMQSADVLACSMMLVYKNDSHVMDSGTIAIVSGSPIARTYLSNYYPNATVSEDYNTLEECLTAVENGEVDGTLLNSYVDELVLRNVGTLKKLQLEGEVSFCYYTTVDKSPLLSVINRGITAYGYDAISNSVSKHIDEAYTTTLKDFVRQYALQFVGGAIVVVAIIMMLVMMVWIRTRQRKHFDYMAHRDSMTGVYNRRAYEEQIAKMANVQLSKDIVYASFDIDDLKGTNDSLGHEAGDELIIGAAQCLKNVLKQYGDIYRLGGDEFVAIFHASKEELARIRQQLKEEFANWHGEKIKRLSVSGGFVEGREFKVVLLSDLVKHADQRMYREKFAGKDTYKVRSRTGNVKNVNGFGKLVKTEEETEMLAAFISAYEARYDLLTGLPTRTSFMDFANNSENPLVDKSLIPTIICFNFSGFKSFNSEYGLTEGDNLLVEFAGILEEIFGKEYCARFAEDRFYAMTKRDALEARLNRLFEKFKNANYGNTLPIRAGVHIYNPKDPVDINTACDRARIACDFEGRVYESRFVFFNEMMKRDTQSREFIINNFERALEDGDIKAYYQPKINLEDESVVGFEVLARWIDAERGMISPGIFIPILEEYSLTHKLDGFMVEQLSRDIKKTMVRGLTPLPVSFNVSKCDFLMIDPYVELSQITEEYGIPRNLVQVEITESNVISAPRKMRGEIARFRKNGFDVLMDDFGSGNSSLSTLRDYEFDEIKFDMGFMKNFGEKSKVILINTIQMAKEFGIRTLCEGVEEQEQIDFLKEAGCEMVQGYYYGKAEPYEDCVEKWL
ncbi:MAG: EAL domain-containing protein [Eubacterium sp.]|nr:EAL domain-containing protein [Eubacterium sp.]